MTQTTRSPLPYTPGSESNRISTYKHTHPTAQASLPRVREQQGPHAVYDPVDVELRSETANMHSQKEQKKEIVDVG